MFGNFGRGYGIRGGQRPLGQWPPSSLVSQSVPRVGGPRMSSYGTQNSGTNISNMGGSRFGSNVNVQGYGSGNYQGSAASGTTGKYSGAANSGIGSGNSYSGTSGNYSGMGSSGTASIGQLGRLGSDYNTTGYSSNYNTSGSNSGYNMSGSSYNTSGSTSDYYTSGSDSYNRGGLDTSYNTSRPGSNYSTGGAGSNYNTGRLGTNIPSASSSARSTADSLTLSDFIGDRRRDDSWDNVKRKYGLGGTSADDHGPKKKPRHSSESVPGNELEVQHRNEPEIQHRNEQEVQRRNVPEVQHRNAPKVQHRNELEVQQRNEPEVQHRNEPEVQHRNVPEVQHRNVPEVRHRDELEVQHRNEPEVQHKEEKILMYLGNMPANVTKEKIETMFEYIPGILAFSLRRHKYNYSNACIIVEMASKEAGEKLKQTFNWMEVNGRCIVCRFCKEGEEENFIPDPDIKTDHFVYKSQAQGTEPVENKKSVYVWNLPAASRKADLEEFVSDLHYKTMNFTNGNTTTGETGYAYFDCEYEEDAERMVAELHKSLYFGSFISARIEQPKQGGDDYVPVQLGEAQDYVSQGPTTSDRPTGQVSAVASLPKRQPSKQFEDYIKGYEKTPLIGLEYITEYSAATKNTPRYLCDLCAATPQGSSVVGHVIGFKHRLKHMEKKDPERYSRIIAMSQQKSFLTNECMKYATEVEQREGRQLISIEQNPQNVQLSLPLDEQKQETLIDPNADLFSRITAYKEKIKVIENKQKEKQLSGSQGKKAQQSGQSAANKQQKKVDPYSEAKEALKNRLATSEEPILGLDFLKPQHDPSNPKQVPVTCQLCGSQLRHLTNLMQHLTGLTHRMEYFKRRHHDLFVECEKVVNRSSQRKLVEEHAWELEKTDGRGTMYIDGEAFTCHPREEGQPKVTFQPTYAQASGSTVQVDMVIVSDDEDKSEGVEALLFDRIKDMANTPLVGLRYVTETQSYNTYDPPKYKCSLCSVEVSKTFIITHLTGHQHRIEYIKKNYPELLRDAESDKDTCTNYCKDIEKDIGREYISVVKMIPPKDLNSQVTYSKPIEVKAPSADAPKLSTPVPKPEPQVEQKKAEESSPAANITTPTPKYLRTHKEKRAQVLQEKIKNKDKLPEWQRQAIEKQLKKDGKKEDGSVVHFYDLIENLENEPLLGLGSCIEVWHPNDTYPPLFHCELCDMNTDFRQILEHIKGSKHKYQFFKIRQPHIYGRLMKIGNSSHRLGELKTAVRRFSKEHQRETIRYTVATSDTPWRTQKLKMNLMRFMRTDAIHKQVVPQSTTAKPGNSSVDNSLANASFQSADASFQSADTSFQSVNASIQSADASFQSADASFQSANASSQMAATSFQSKEPRTDKVIEEKGSSVADLIDATVINDDKWTEVNAEVKKRINDGRILICKEPAKFLKTYKPFLGRFPVIGLEWLSEFQKENEDAHPWYLCRLCRSKIDWNDVVDHVVSLYHRMCFIEREHPTLHELLKESKFETGEINEKIEEFAKGIAKPTSEQLLEVLIEKGTKQHNQSPKKDFSSMASRQSGDIPKRLDSEPVKGPQTASNRQGIQGSEGVSRPQPLDNRGQRISEDRWGPRTPDARSAPSGITPRKDTQPAEIARRPSGSDMRGGPQFGDRRTGQDRPSGSDVRGGPQFGDRRTGQDRASGPDVRGGPQFGDKRTGQDRPSGPDVRGGPQFGDRRTGQDRPSGSDVRGGPQLEDRRTGQDRPGSAQKRPASESMPTADQSSDAKKARTDIPKKIPGAIARFADMYGRQAKGPLIGLNYMLEIQVINSKKPAHYYCELCDSKMIPGSVLDHLYGFRHRQNFFTKHCPEQGVPTEKKVSDYVRKHGTGRVSVARETKEEQLQKRLDAKAERMEAKAAKKAYNAAKRQDKELLERLEQGRDHQHDVKSKQTPGQDISERQLNTNQRQPVPPSRVTITNRSSVQQPVQGNPNQTTYRPDRSSTNEPTRSIQQGSVVSSAPLLNIPQNQQPQLQQSKPLLQQQQMQLQQPRQLMLQQQTGPIMQQQQPQLQQFQPVMQQQQLQMQQQQLQMQQPGPLMQQTPMLSQMTPSMNASNQMFMQQPQMVSHVNPNLVQGSQQNMGMQNVASNQYSQSGMLGHGPQQNIQMGMQAPNMVPASQQIMTQQQPQIFKGVCYPVPVTTANNNPAKQTTNKTQHIQTKISNRFKYQKQTTSSTDSQRGTQFKQNKSDKSNKAERNLSNYRIPLKNSPKKDYRQENYFDNRQKGKDTKETRESKTTESNDKKTEKTDSRSRGSGSGSTRDDRFGSRTTESKSKDVRGTDYRKDSSRSSSLDSKQKDLNKFRSPDRRQADENKNKDNERKQNGGSLTKSPYNSQKDEGKATIGSDKKRDENKSSQERKTANKLEKTTTSVKVELTGKQGQGKDSRADDMVRKAGVSENKSKIDKGRKSGSYIEIEGSETGSRPTSKETDSDKTVITIDVTPLDNNLKSKLEKYEMPLDKAKKREIGSPLVSKKLHEQSKDKTKVEEKRTSTPEKKTGKLNETATSSKQAVDKLSCTVTIEESKDEPKVDRKNKSVDMPECTVTIEPLKDKPKEGTKTTSLSMLEKKTKKLNETASSSKQALDTSKGTPENKTKILNETASSSKQALDTSIGMPEKKTKKLNDTTSSSKQALDKLSCTVTVDLFDIGKVSNSKSNELKQLVETGSSPRKGSGAKESVIVGSSLFKSVTKVSPQKDKNTNFKSKSNIETSTINETSQTPELTAKHLESSISSGQQSRKSEPNHNSIVRKTTVKSETEKPKLKTSGSVEDEHPDEWAVTDEWCEDEEMEVDEIKSNLTESNKENSKAATDNTNHVSQSDKDIKSTQKEKEDKTEDIEVDTVGVKIEAAKKEVHSAVVIEKATPVKEMKLMEELPNVSVTVEFDEEETHATKSTPEKSVKYTEKIVDVGVGITDTSVSKKDTVKESEKEANIVESMEVAVTAVEKADQEQSDDDEDFFDLSEFVTLDEEGEVDEIVVVSAEQADSQSSCKGESDFKSEKSRRRAKSRSQDRSLDRSSVRDSSQSDHKSPKSDRSGSEDTGYGKSEHANADKLSRRSRSPPKGEYCKGSAAAKKEIGPMQGKPSTEKVMETKTPSGTKPTSETKADRGSSQKSGSNQSSIIIDEEEEQSTPEAEKPTGGFEASSRALGKVFPSKGVPVSGSSKKATQETKSDAAKATKSSVVVELGTDNTKTETDVASSSSQKATQEVKSDVEEATKSSVVVELGTDNTKTETDVVSISSQKATQEVKSDVEKATKSSVVVELGPVNSTTYTTGNVASGRPKKATPAKSKAGKARKSSVVVELGPDSSKTETTVAGRGVEKESGGGGSKKEKDKDTVGEAKSNQCTVEIDLGESGNRRSLRSSAGKKSTNLSDSKKSSDKVSKASMSAKPKCEVSISFE